jgi:phage baseplate assembly protein gpV
VSAATTAVPSLRVEWGGRALSESLARSLVQVTVRHQASCPSVCELLFADAEEGRGATAPEAGLELALSDADGRLLFRGHCSAWSRRRGAPGSAGRELRLRAYDSLHLLRQSHPLRHHVDRTTAELFRQWVQSLGLDVQATESGPRWPRLLQHGQSDLELASEVAAWSGLRFALADGTLQLFGAEGHADAAPLTWGDDLQEFEEQHNFDRSQTEVELWGQDWIEAAEHLAREGAPAARGLGSAFSAGGSLAGDGLEGVLRHTGLCFGSAEEAQVLAAALEGNLRARRRRCRGKAHDRLDLRPGLRVAVRGVEEGASEPLVLDTVVHRIRADGGASSEFDTTPSALALPRPQPLALVGVVTDLDDPRALGRVQVRLPALGELLSAWMPQLTAGAGADKGLWLPPDLDDQVLVLLWHPITAQGVVLGGLHGDRGGLAPSLEGGRTRRFFLRSPGGQSLVFDDLLGSLRLQIDDGSFLELGPQGVQLHAASDLTLEAPGRQLTLGAQRVDFERR